MTTDSGILKRPTILKRKRVAQTRLFQVEQLDLRFANGVERTYERLCSAGHGAVVVVGVTAAGGVLLVREYSAGMDDYQWGLPRGAIDFGESNLEAANRELMEEAGHGAHRLRFLKSIHLVPSYMQRKIDIVLAEDLYPESRPGDEPEPLEVMVWPLANLAELVARADVTDSPSIAALYLARDYLRDTLSPVARTLVEPATIAVAGG